MKAIPGYEGRYSVTKDGRIYLHSQNRLSNPAPNSRGYVTLVLINKDGKRSTQRVHRLVAQAFIPNPNKKQCVNHIDGDTTNNAISNLEWCTQHENLTHASSLGLFSGKRVPSKKPGVPTKKKRKESVNAKLTPTQQGYVRANYIRGSRTHSYKALGAMFNVSGSTIRDAVRGTSYK